MNTRMNRKKFHFGLYTLKPAWRTEEHIRAVAEMGTNVVLIDNGRDTYDLLHKYGIGAIAFWWDPLPHWGGEGYGYLGRMPEKFPLEECYIAPSRTYQDHPAVWALEMADEPSAMDFPYIGTVVDTVNHAYPNQFPYINLYPNHARVAENTEDEIKSDLGTTSYVKYLEKYCQYVPTDYISYDYYLYGGAPQWRDWTRGGKLSRYYENFRLVADLCRKYGKDFWMVMLGNMWEDQPWGQMPSFSLSANMLRFQAYTALAFGVKCLLWWESWVFDENGKKTEQYDRMKQVQNEIHTFADEYMRYRNVYTHFVGFDGYPDLTSVEQKGVESLDNGIFFDLKSDSNTPLVIGQMVCDEDHSHALMISPADDPFDENPLEYTITFRVGKRAVHAYGGDGPIPVSKTEDGLYSVPVRSNRGVLLTAR